MKTRVPLFLILFVLAWSQHAAGQAQSAASWSRYTYPGEEFSVELPSMPLLHHARRASTTDYRKSEPMRVFNLYADGVIYFVVAYDKPRGAESFDFFAAYLRGAWGLVPEGALTLAGFEGRAYNVVGTQRGRNFYDVHGKARVFRTKRHAYLALALATEPGRPEVEHFLNMFALGERPAGEMIAEDTTVPPAKQEGAATGTEERLKLVRRERAPGEPHTMQEVESKALIVYKPEPPYTEEARKKQVTGVVRLRVVLNASGQVTDAEVIKSLPNGLTENSLRIARQMRFFPARKGSLPVSQYVVLEYNFNIY